jgi:hypothetical protein
MDRVNGFSGEVCDQLTGYIYYLRTDRSLLYAVRTILSRTLTVAEMTDLIANNCGNSKAKDTHPCSLCCASDSHKAVSCASR